MRVQHALQRNARLDGVAAGRSGCDVNELCVLERALEEGKVQLKSSEGTRIAARAPALCLQRDQIQIIHCFSNGVLHLQAGVGLDEPKVVVPNEEFNGAEGGEGRACGEEFDRGGCRRRAVSTSGPCGAA